MDRYYAPVDKIQVFDRMIGYNDYRNKVDEIVE